MEHYFTNDPYLKSEIRTLNYKRESYSFTFFSDNGVFAKDKIDYGSAFLLDVFLKNKDKEIKSILDVGCGYGFIGIVLSKILDIEVDMIDVNKRALHLAERNSKEMKVKAQAFLSDGYESVEKEYDVIITNPPIRAGKEVVMRILINAKEHLNQNGTLWFVMRKDHGVKSTIKKLEETYQTEIIEKSKGFYVVKAQIR
ncbi:MAG: methyltransferase [Bacilli bacterium]|nr:methyltransferase [Bacilli bacterium]